MQSVSSILIEFRTCMRACEQLLKLWKKYPGDSGDPSTLPIPSPDPKDTQPDGRYRHVETDEWGTVWEHRIFGVSGIAIQRPLDDLPNLKDYRPPAPLRTSGEDFERELKVAYEHKKRYYLLKAGHACISELIQFPKLEVT